MIVLLDSGPLGMVTNPNASPENDECYQWLESLISRSIEVAVPEIADYEIRRELIRADKTQGLARLDILKKTIGYIPITTQAMLKAAEFWAEARKQGRPTADDKALDADVILAAQAACLTDKGHEAVIATTNVKHLTLFVVACKWGEIR
jgi:predicted nucleic acid-binding protein